jgi:hypothetical protein
LEANTFRKFENNTLIKLGGLIMCHFVSWIEKDGKIYFLQNSDLATKIGKKVRDELQKDGSYWADICGHESLNRILHVRCKDPKRHQEIENLENPKNLPKEIVKAIKSGAMTRIGIPCDPEDLLSKKVARRFRRISEKKERYLSEVLNLIDECNNAMEIRIPVYDLRRQIEQKTQGEVTEAFWILFLSSKNNRADAWK